MAKFLIPAQTRAAGEGVTLNDTGVNSCAVWHEDGAVPITLRGSGCPKNPARYDVSAHVIVTGAAANTAVQLALVVDGEPLPDGLMAVVPVAVGAVWSADVTTQVTAGSTSRISLRAITAAQITGGNVIVSRVS